MDHDLIGAGRFPRNEIISLLNVNRAFNLAESTSQDLQFGELLDLVGEDTLRNLHLGYGSAQGLPHLRSEIAAMCSIPPEQVVTTIGAALALYLLAIELCRPNDEVILFTPCFPLSINSMIGAGVMVRELPLSFDDGYAIDLNRFEALLSSKTKLISLATPQNPSGVVTSPETLEAMLAIMERIAPRAMLLVDETYRYATYGNDVTPKSFAGHDPRIISTASVTKAYGAPGLRVGWMTASDKHLRDRLINAKMNVVISGSPLNETLAAHLLAKRELILEPRRRMLAAALKILVDWQASEFGRIEWVRPNAGALTCLRLKKDQFNNRMVQHFWEMQAEHNLQLASGSWFGESSRVFRLGFGYLPLEILPRALEVVSDVMTKVQGLSVDS